LSSPESLASTIIQRSGGAADSLIRALPGKSSEPVLSAGFGLVEEGGEVRRTHGSVRDWLQQAGIVDAVMEPERRFGLFRGRKRAACRTGASGRCADRTS